MILLIRRIHLYPICTSCWGLPLYMLQRMKKRLNDWKYQRRFLSSNIRNEWFLNGHLSINILNWFPNWWIVVVCYNANLLRQFIWSCPFTNKANTHNPSPCTPIHTGILYTHPHTQAVNGMLDKSVWEQLGVCKTVILLYEKPSFTPSACQLMSENTEMRPLQPRHSAHMTCIGQSLSQWSRSNLAITDQG